MNKKLFTLILSFSLITNSFSTSTITATFSGRYNSGFYNKDGGVMEISAYDKTKKKTFCNKWKCWRYPCD